MDNLIGIVVSNTVVAATLAAATLMITRVWRSPQLAHTLWLLVLIKLITPPIVAIPIPQHLWSARSEKPETAIDQSQPMLDDARSAPLAISNANIEPRRDMVVQNHRRSERPLSTEVSSQHW